MTSQVQLFSVVECHEIRTVVGDESVILPEDSGHQLPILVSPKAEKRHMFTYVPGGMGQGD
jgi:hypothetical protein